MTVDVQVSNLNYFFLLYFFNFYTKILNILELDLPKLISLDLVSSKIRVEFYLPKAINYAIEFKLLEKYNNKIEQIYEIYNYTYKSSLPENIDSITFNKPISSKHNVEYHVEFKITKNCYDEKLTGQGTFEDFYVVPFPGLVSAEHFFALNIYI